MATVESKAPDSDVTICSPATNRRILKSDHSGRIFMLPLPGKRLNGVRRVSFLSELEVGETGILVGLNLPDSVQNHLMHMGFVPDAAVTVLRRAPAGDPTVFAIDGMEIALRRETASAIEIRAADAESELGEQQQPASTSLIEVAQ